MSISKIYGARPVIRVNYFEMCIGFYKDLGFSVKMLSEDLAEMRVGLSSFFLKNSHDDFHANPIMDSQVLSLKEYWYHIDGLMLPKRYPVKSPVAPHVAPWGQSVIYVFDPCGTNWQFSEEIY